MLLATGCALLVNRRENAPLPALAPEKFYLMECFPTSNWRKASLQPLPGHANVDAVGIRAHAMGVATAFGLRNFVADVDLIRHDDLQAVVAALPAAALMGGPCDAVAAGHPARKIPPCGGAPGHSVEGLIWDAVPKKANLPPAAKPMRAERLRPLTSTDFQPDRQAIDRGIRLFAYLAACANRGDAVGIGYADFIAYLFSRGSFTEVAGRPYRNWHDSPRVIQLAQHITDIAGRQEVRRAGTLIGAGMDTFIWNSSRPYDRPASAWTVSYSTVPYRREEWLKVFPDDARRLIGAAELDRVAREPH